MNPSHGHTFHIPVMGLGYTVDTPLKVARFGISSVISVIQDILIEQMREFHCKAAGEEFIPIPIEDIEHRSKRVRAYLDLIQRIIDRQMHKLRNEAFAEGAEVERYFLMLPEDSPLKQRFLEMKKASGKEKEILEESLRKSIVQGSIDVNIMTKIDNPAYSPEGVPLAAEYSDASSALIGYAQSSLCSSIVFSAGFNPRLFAFLEKFPDFFPDENGFIRKKIILKVSDFRSALVQGKFLAKKGLWISEFRIESGLNCGGHAFPTEGLLLGPILEDFREKKAVLEKELWELCSKALEAKKMPPLPASPRIALSVQGGIGTAEEDRFLRSYYKVDKTGWGSPFLLVPEATNVDKETLGRLSRARQEDYFLSRSSPLGIPFNNFRKSSSEDQRKLRIKKNRPGSPCYKKYLSFNTEFTGRAICVSSRQYQELKLKELGDGASEKERNDITAKDCLCEGLAASALSVNNIPEPHGLTAVTICPGPNLAFFSGVFSLEEMVSHIYGRKNLLNSLYRPHMFINELRMYVDYLAEETARCEGKALEKQAAYFNEYRENLLKGIAYYTSRAEQISPHPEERKKLMEEAGELRSKLTGITLPLLKPQC